MWNFLKYSNSDSSTNQKADRKFKNRPEAEVLIGLNQAKIQDHLIFEIVIAARSIVSMNIRNLIKNFWRYGAHKL